MNVKQPDNLLLQIHEALNVDLNQSPLGKEKINEMSETIGVLIRKQRKRQLKIIGIEVFFITIGLIMTLKYLSHNVPKWAITIWGIGYLLGFVWAFIVKNKESVILLPESPLLH